MQAEHTFRLAVIFIPIFKEDDIIMRFAMYGRKSIYSDRSDSVGNQERMCQEYAEMRFPGEIETFEVYSDEGMTGANTNRPGLKRLLADVSEGLVDALIVYQLDRLSRDVKDFANIYAVLEEKGVMFISLKESIDTNTPIGKAMMFITATFAQMERETIATRVADNMIGLAKKGFWLGGNPPYGYRKKEITAVGKRHVVLELDPEAAKYDEWIFDKFLSERYSLQGMATDFRKKGIKTINGGFFSISQLYNLLTMPYCVEGTQDVYDYFAGIGCSMDADSPREQWDGTRGVMVYGRTTGRNSDRRLAQGKDKWVVCLGHHRPFISADKWLAVQERFRQNTFNKTAKYEPPLLKGVLRCAKCGCLMGVSRKKTVKGVTSHYHCLKRMRQGVEGCDMRFIKCCVLDEKVLAIFREIEYDKKSILKYADAGKPQENAGSALRNLEMQAYRIQEKIRKLTESIADTDGSSAAKYIISQIEKEDLSLGAVRREIESEKLRIRREKSTVKTAEAKAKEVEGLIRGLDGFSAVRKNEVVKRVLKECTWDGSELFLRF